MLMVFNITNSNDHENIILLNFEPIKKIMQENFPYTTRTNITRFIDCESYLIAFMNRIFEKDIGFNAIILLCSCPTKLIEGILFTIQEIRTRKQLGSLVLQLLLV